jgi:DNA-binding transcriptional LysR family regulator
VILIAAAVRGGPDEDYWYRRFHRDRGIDYRLSREKWQKMDRRFYSAVPALEALDAGGRAWRLAYNSPSRDVLRMAVETGLVVTVLPDSLIGPRLQRLGPGDNLPALPEMEILLHEKPAPTDRSLEVLADVIEEILARPDPFAG